MFDVSVKGVFTSDVLYYTGLVYMLPLQATLCSVECCFTMECRASISLSSLRGSLAMWRREWRHSY